MNKKLRIAIIGSRGYPYVYSGYETLIKELSERLVKKDLDVRVYCHSALFVKKPKFVNGVELVYTPSLKSKFFSQLYNSFFSFLHVCFSSVDVILVVNSANGPFGLLTKIFRKKTLINVDGLEWLRPKWKGFGSYYFEFASMLATIFYDVIITDSFQMSMIYKRKFNKESEIICYGPTMVKTHSDSFIKKLKLKKNGYYLIVGRLIPDNNSKLVLQSFLKSNSTKKIVVVGDVPYRDNYADKVKEMASEKIILTGYIKSQEKLSELYENCYCYVHGHEFGGTNPTMINALSLNCQIIALNTVFNIEMLKNKEVLFFEKNIKSIVNTIKKFENQYQKIIMKNEYYTIPKKYDWENISEKYYQLFQLKK